MHQSNKNSTTFFASSLPMKDELSRNSNFCFTQYFNNHILNLKFLSSANKLKSYPEIINFIAE